MIIDASILNRVNTTRWLSRPSSRREDMPRQAEDQTFLSGASPSRFVRRGARVKHGF